MNVFLSQSIQTQIELEEIADVKRQIITPATSRTIIGIVQDGLIGSYNLTSPTMRVDWKTAMNIMSYTTIDNFNAFKKNKEYTGHELFSMIIPPKINVVRGEKDKQLIIKNGILEKGSITKELLGSKKKNNLTQLIWDEYGVEPTREFLDNTQRLINNFNLFNGFTVGIGDASISQELEEEIHKMFETKDIKIAHMITELENNPDLMDLDLFERTLFAELNVIREDVSKLLMNNLSPNNNFNIMISSGSKGEPANMGQMAGCVGLQAFEGKLVPKKLNRRTLPYFFKDDDRSSSRGLIKRPFLRGMTFPEFFFHNLTGREGLIDQAIKSVTGDTNIIIIEDGKFKCIRIGNWIDEKLNDQNNKRYIEHHQVRDMELLNLRNKVYIPTVNKSGKVTWGNITAITRHDPGNELYEICTYGGRRVIVTESKSLLIWNDKKNIFERMSTPDVKINNYVPVTAFLTSPPVIEKYIDNFELNRDSGTFVGLMLSENNIVIDNCIQITNKNVIKFIEKWFSDNKIEYVTNNNIISNSILDKYKFLTNIITSKCIPSEAFIAPDSFVIGLLDGYVSSNGNIDSSIKIELTEKLLDGISILCSRLGIFGKVKNNKLLIKGKWINTFSEKIELTDKDKNDQIKRLKKLRNNKINKKFRIEKDVVLDRIISINKIDINKYPKVYDLTVPSTLNFGLANGLHVVDTAESGYIQRKLIKSMEDAMIRYDGTVRTASNSILQFIYGDSGVDTTKQYEYNMKLIEMNNSDIVQKHFFTKDELNNFDNFSEKDNDDYYQYLIRMRDLLRTSQIKTRMNYITMSTIYMLPVNLTRIIENNRHDESLKLSNKADNKLDPKYILDTIEKILDNRNTQLLTMTTLQRNDKNSLKNKDDRIAKTALSIALHDSLSPKRCIMEYQINKVQFDSIVDEVINNYNKNLAEPGEMAGIIAAQSLGEPTTQLSTIGTTYIRISGAPAQRYIGNIKNFIDKLMKDNKNKVKILKEKDENGLESSVLDLDNDYYIASVSKNEKVNWKRISAVSRHPANGQLVKVHTRSGKTTTATLSHSFLKKTENCIVPVKGSELKVNDRIPITKFIPVFKNFVKKVTFLGTEIILDKLFGWFCGAYLADGSINGNRITITKLAIEFKEQIDKICERFQNQIHTRQKGHIIIPGVKRKYDDKIYKGQDISFTNKPIASFLTKHFGKGLYIKKIGEYIYSTNKEFISGIISGYIDGDGNVQYDDQHKAIRASSRSEQLIADMCILVNYCGMHATKGEEKHKDQDGVYHVIHIPSKYAQKFKDEVGLVTKEKLDNLNKIIEYNNRSDKHSNKEEIDMIPQLGNIISQISEKLKMEGHSRLYKRFTKKEAIGRETLGKIIKTFAAEIEIQSKNNTLTVKEYTKANKAELRKRRIKQAKKCKKPLKKVMVVYKDVLKTLDDDEQKLIKEKLKILEDAYNSDVVWDQIIKLEILDDPKEYVYDFTVPGFESFMVDTGILVHNTLNSVDYVETILLNDRKTNKFTTVEMGKFIDELIKDNPRTNKIKDDIFNERSDTYYLDIKDKELYVQSVTENGKIEWKLIEAITKHLPMNKDGTNTVLEIKTKSGKKVIATKAKSFLTRINNKIMPIRGDELQIGTLIPVARKRSKSTKLDDRIPGNNLKCMNLIKSENNGIITKDKIRELLSNHKNEISQNEIQILNDVINSDIYYDEIIMIKEIKPSRKYVYDLTVADTKTFCISNGLCMMDSFHHTGIAAISTTTQGVPRIKELLSLTKNLKTPQMIIYPTREYMSSRDMANKIASYIKFTTLGHIRDRLTVYYDPDPYRKGGFIEKDNATKVFSSKSTSKYSCQSDVAALPWLLRIEFNRENLLEKEVTLLDIKSKFCNIWEKRHSDKTIKKEEKYVFEKVTQIALLSNTDYDKIPIIHIRFDMTDFDMTILNDFIDYIIDKFKLKGIASISNISAINEERVLTFDNENNDIEKKKQYVIYTMGINLYDIRYINGIDINRTICNDVIAMYETFGIEAARSTLLREIIYAYERAGSSVNYHHVSVLIDLMTFNGYLTSIDRHGMNKSDVGPLSRASFEKTVDQLETAAVFGEIDHMNGVSSRIMAGLVIKGGTGLCNVILDTEMIQNSEFTEDIGQKYVKTYNEISGNNFMTDIINRTEENDMFIPV